MKGLLITIALLLSVSIACAPKAAPAPVPATPAPISIPTSNISPPTSQPPASQDAWAKVVAEAKKEGKVTLYTWAFVGDIGQEVFRAFQQTAA